MNNNSITTFLKQTDQIGYNGSNNAINQRLDNSFNQFTNLHNDECSYVNEMRILRKPLKYYVNQIWTPAPNNNTDYSYFTAVGNQKTYNVKNNLVYPEIGSPTHLRNKRYIQYVLPLVTSPQLGNNAINTSDIDINSKLLRIGEPTNLNILPKDVTSATDYNRWEFVDANIVQNPKHIIFADGVIPRGGMSSRNELQNYAELQSC
jgi:hypothetical protein